MCQLHHGQLFFLFFLANTPPPPPSLLLCPLDYTSLSSPPCPALPAPCISPSLSDVFKRSKEVFNREVDIVCNNAGIAPMLFEDTDKVCTVVEL